MEITGRITADAVIRNLTDGRQVVSFDLAVNDFYRTREGEPKQIATYFDCSYWITTRVAQHLTRGSIVELYGRVGAYAYKDKEGNPQATLQFHVNNIRFIAGSSKPQSAGAAAAPATTGTKDDLPF